MKKIAILIITFSFLINSAEMAAGTPLSSLPAVSIEAPVFHLVALFRTGLTVMQDILKDQVPLAPVFSQTQKHRDTVDDRAMGTSSIPPENRRLSASGSCDAGAKDTTAVPCVVLPSSEIRRCTGSPPGGDSIAYRFLLSYLVLLSLTNLPGELAVFLCKTPAAYLRVRVFSFTGEPAS